MAARWLVDMDGSRRTLVGGSDGFRARVDAVDLVLCRCRSYHSRCSARAESRTSDSAVDNEHRGVGRVLVLGRRAPDDELARFNPGRTATTDRRSAILAQSDAGKTRPDELQLDSGR